MDGARLGVELGGVQHHVQALIFEIGRVVQVSHQLHLGLHQAHGVEVVTPHEKVKVAPPGAVIHAGPKQPHPCPIPKVPAHKARHQLLLSGRETHRSRLNYFAPSNGIAPSLPEPSKPVRV